MSSRSPAPSPSSSASPSSIPPLWRQNPTASASTKRQADWRRWWIFALLACILALAGALIGLLSWIRPLPRPYLFPIWVSSYQSRQISFLPWAEQDHRVLSRGSAITRVVNAPFGSQDRRMIGQSLALLGELVPTDSVVVYVNARACIGPKGGVSLLPADADPADVSTWLPLNEVLESLRASPAGWKLLVLDLMKPQGGARPALLNDDVASRVPVDLKAVEDPRRLTLTASAPGQFSLTSEELGRSVFSYYFEEALRGWTELDRPRLSREGLVRVSDLATFVRGRVDRWARLNRGVRQEPVLYGTGADFPLLALKHDQLRPAPPLPPPADYPDWLEAGWAMRDRWRADGSERIAPLAFRQLEHTLLISEAEWRGGVDPARIRQDRMADLPTSQQALERIQGLTRPKPASLAMAETQGWTLDPTLAAAAKELLVARGHPTQPAQTTASKPETSKSDSPGAPVAAKTATPGSTPAPDPAAVFAAKSQAASTFDLAGALFEAARGAEPTRENILFLDGLLRDHQPEPLFVETLFLRQLADLAREIPTAAAWPTETVRRALKVTSQGERANRCPEALAWLRLPLEEAARIRHDAEVILRARGFAAIEEADRLFRVAESRYTEILEQQSVVLEARHRWLEALHVLPGLQNDGQSSTVGHGLWQETVDQAIVLHSTLTLPDEVTSGRAPLAVDEVRRRIDLLRAESNTLGQTLEGLRRPYSDAALTALIAQARSRRAGPEMYRAIDARLRSPLPSAKQRAALWRAARDLARRLLDETLKLDRSPLDSESVLAATSPRAESSRLRRQLADRAQQRISLLRLAGLPESEAGKLSARAAKASAMGADHEVWWNLEWSLRAAWEGESSGAVVRQAESLDQSRLNPLVAPSWSLSATDTTPKGWFFSIWLRENQALWAWLADHYEYEGADLGGASFYRTSARELRAMTPTDRAGLSSPWKEPDPGATLSVDAPAMTESLQLRVPTPAPDHEPVPVDVLLPDRSWLRVDTASTLLRRRDRSGGDTDPLNASFLLTAPAGPGKTSSSNLNLREVPLRVEFDPEAEESDTPIPQGFLVRSRVGGRDFHLAVPVKLQLESRRMQILLSANSKAPTDPQPDLGLRAIKDRQAYFLYLRNPTSDPQDVLVELALGDQLVPGAPPRLTVAPGAIARVQFAPGPIKADVPLPELTLPLQIRLRSAGDKTTLLGESSVGVRIAAPAEYVRVSQVEYAPSGPGLAAESRLSVGLQAIPGLAGPPAVAQLVLPADQIPGFLGMGDGTLRGVLPEDGKPLSLFVKGLRRMPGADSTGRFYVQVDSYPRGIAFRATFPVEGQATFPVEDARPALRLRAARSSPATTSFPVRAEVDNPGPGTSLEIVLGRSQTGSFEPEKIRRFPTAQHHRIGFTPGGPDGSLLFEASAEDWSTTLDLTGVEGARILRARLLDAAGNEIQAVSQPLLIDDNLPTGPTFIALPAQARRGTKLTVRATALATDSGIDEVKFFVGRPPAAGASLPATLTTVPGLPDPAADGVWSAELSLPDLKGPTDLAAQFETGAGRTSYATATIELTDTDPVTPGRIVGTLLEGPRPQPGLVVVLTKAATDESKSGDPKAKTAPQKKDAERTEIARATTTADGTFRFDDLPPGLYRLSATKDASRTKAGADVTVRVNATSSVMLELFR